MFAMVAITKEEKKNLKRVPVNYLIQNNFEG